MQVLDVVLHPLDQLSLVLPDGAADVRPHEQRVKSGEDTEHFVGILGSSQLVSQTSSDPCLNSVNPLIISDKVEDITVNLLSMFTDL